MMFAESLFTIMTSSIFTHKPPSIEHLTIGEMLDALQMGVVTSQALTDVGSP
jgi:hypothetical protein